MLCAGLLFVTASKGWRCAAARATCARVRAHCCAALRPVFCSPRRCAAAAFAMATSPRPHIGSNDDDDSQPQSAHRRAATKRRSVAGGGGSVARRRTRTQKAAIDRQKRSIPHPSHDPASLSERSLGQKLSSFAPHPSKRLAHSPPATPPAISDLTICAPVGACDLAAVTRRAATASGSLPLLLASAAAIYVLSAALQGGTPASSGAAKTAV